MAQALSNLPIGAKIKYGKHSVNGETAQPIIWLVVSKNTGATTSGKPQNSITLLTEKVIDFRCFDAIEPNNVNFSNMQGFAKYSVSNIRQWMNSSATGGWYSAQHTYDYAPSTFKMGSGEVIDTTWFNTQYVNRPGFLYHFSEAERNNIMNTSIDESFISGGSTQTTTLTNQKIFLPSRAELLTGWEYFAKGASKECFPTAQAVENSTVSITQSTYYSANWWTRTQFATSQSSVYFVFGNTLYEDGGGDVYRGNYGLRPAMNLPTTLRISDTTDSDGCYIAEWNTAPSAPSILNIPTIYGGRANSISWSTANDPDGDSVTYTLECSIDKAAYSVLFIGDSTVCAHMLPFGKTTVQYRVKATDPSNASSAYTTSPVINVINNHYPEISDSDANFGVKKAGFAVSYQITDADYDRVIVTEAIDGVPIQVKEVQLGVMNTLSVKDNTWLVLPNGSHTITISASDGIDTSVRTYTFTKLVDQFIITNSPAWDSTTMPTRIMLVVTRNIPRDATFKVEVCNNFYDPVPIWDDATDAVKSGLVHVFSNKTSTVNKWAVKFKITVNRNGASGACYVSAIGGNFE